MLPLRVVFYQDKDGTVPMMQWLEGLRSQPKHRAKCIRWLTLLRAQGHRLRRPMAAHLRDGIHELRVQFGFENYRMLYFFFAREYAIVTHGITKHSDEVPQEEIDRALRFRQDREEDLQSHIWWWEGD